MIRIPSELVVLAAVAGVYYMWTVRKRQKTGNLRACFKLAVLWSIWTLVALIHTVKLIPPPPPPPDVPRIYPTPGNIFSIAVYYVFLPAFAVWVLMMLDLIIYVLKTRHRIRAANQSESKQVKALHSP